MGWAAHHAIAIISGLLAALWVAVGIVVRQRVAQTVPADQDSSATMSSLLTSPLWWAGTLAAVGGWHGLMTVPAPYLLVALAVAVTVVQNSAFHAGALQASVPIMLVGEPVVAVLLGVVVLGEHLAVRGSAALGLIVAVVAMVAATIALGRDQAPESDAPSSKLLGAQQDDEFDALRR